MDKDIELAKQAKFPVNHPDWADAARRFADLIRADEREACAKVCDEARAARLAEKIRAGGTPSEPAIPNDVIASLQRDGMTLVKDSRGYRLMNLGKIEALSTLSAPSEPVAKPLTSGQVVTISDAAAHFEFGDDFLGDIGKIIDMVEAAHGITAPSQEGA